MEHPVIRLKPHRLHVQMNGDVTVDYEFFILSAKQHHLRLLLPQDQLTKAVNSLHVWIENRPVDNVPTIILPSPTRGLDFPLKTHKFDPLQSNIGAHIEFTLRDKLVSGILRNVTYERRFNILNIVLEDSDQPGTFVVHSLDSDFQGDVRITPHDAEYEAGLDSGVAEAFVTVPMMKEDTTGMYGTLRASYKITTPTTGKGFDISYRLTVLGNQPPAIGAVRKGELCCHALFENPLPETLENVKVTFEVSPKEMMNPTDPSHVFRSDRPRFPEFLTGYELFMPNQSGKVKEHDSGSNNNNNNNSDAGVSNGLDSDTADSTSPPLYYSLKNQLALQNIILESSKLLTVFRNKSEKVLLFEWTVNTQVLHMFDLKPFKESRAEEIADIELYIWKSEHDMYVPGFVNITYADHSPRTFTGYMDKSGFIILENGFVVRPTVRCLQTTSYKFDQECRIDENIPHVCISDGDMCINEPAEDTIKVFLTNEGNSIVHIGLPFIRPSHKTILRKLTAFQYKSDNAIATDNEIGKIRRSGKELKVKEMSIYNRDHVVFARVEGHQSAIVLIKTKLYSEYSLYIKDITMDDIESLAKWDDISEIFITQLRKLYRLELDLNEKKREQFHVFKHLRNLRGMRGSTSKTFGSIVVENSDDDDVDGDVLEHDVNGSEMRKRKEEIKKMSDEFDKLCAEICELENEERRMRYELHNVPYKSIRNAEMRHRTVRRIKSVFGGNEEDVDEGRSESVGGPFKMRQMRAALSRQDTM